MTNKRMDSEEALESYYTAREMREIDGRRRARRWRLWWTNYEYLILWTNYEYLVLGVVVIVAFIVGLAAFGMLLGVNQ